MIGAVSSRAKVENVYTGNAVVGSQVSRNGLHKVHSVASREKAKTWPPRNRYWRPVVESGNGATRYLATENHNAPYQPLFPTPLEPLELGPLGPNALLGPTLIVPQGLSRVPVEHEPLVVQESRELLPLFRVLFAMGVTLNVLGVITLPLTEHSPRPLQHTVVAALIQGAIHTESTLLASFIKTH